MNDKKKNKDKEKDKNVKPEQKSDHTGGHPDPDKE